MKIVSKITFVCAFLGATTAFAQHLTLKMGGNYNQTLQKEIPDDPFRIFAGYDPKYGYQLGLAYTQDFAKSFYFIGEISFMNKGHNALLPTTKEKLYEVNYNYLYVRPALGYKLPFNFSVEMGIPIGFYWSPKTPPITEGTIRKQEFAFSAHLNWEYKKVGAYIGFQQSIPPMQDIDYFGLKIEHRHRTLTAGVSYRLF
jgi:hypothetical protein